MCEDEGLALNQSDEDIKDRMLFTVVERETKSNQLNNIQRILTLMDKNMTLVVARLSLNCNFYDLFLIR